jgi:hypothetical protein
LERQQRLVVVVVVHTNLRPSLTVQTAVVAAVAAVRLLHHRNPLAARERRDKVTTVEPGILVSIRFRLILAAAAVVVVLVQSAMRPAEATQQQTVVAVEPDRRTQFPVRQQPMAAAVAAVVQAVVVLQPVEVAAVDEEQTSPTVTPR